MTGVIEVFAGQPIPVDLEAKTVSPAARCRCGAFLAVQANGRAAIGQVNGAWMLRCAECDEVFAVTRTEANQECA